MFIRRKTLYLDIEKLGVKKGKEIEKRVLTIKNKL